MVSHSPSRISRRMRAASAAAKWSAKRRTCGGDYEKARACGLAWLSLRAPPSTYPCGSDLGSEQRLRALKGDCSRKSTRWTRRTRSECSSRTMCRSVIPTTGAASAVGRPGTQARLNNGKSLEIQVRQQIAYSVASERISTQDIKRGVFRINLRGSLGSRLSTSQLTSDSWQYDGLSRRCRRSFAAAYPAAV